MELTATIKPWVVDPPDEPCGGADALPMVSFSPPAQFAAAPIQGLASAEGRLILGLREAAQTRDAMEILARASVAFYRAAHPPTSDTVELGNALADLAMTGRAAYQSWPSHGMWPDNEVELKAITRNRLPSSATDADVDAAVSAALDRAHAVAWALRGPAAGRAAARSPLGWIAVSGEDDSPHRPVNLPAPRLGTVELEQFEIPVSVRGVTVQTRFFIASAVDVVVPPAATPSTRVLPPDPAPLIPAGHEVILSLHGHSSSAEEALAIIPHLHTAGLARGIRYAVVSFDLPNSGYSEMFDHSLIPGTASFMPLPGPLVLPIRTPVLDATEDFVVAFVDALDAITPVKSRFAGVIGGSLGGNLGLRLGRRPGTPWLAAGSIVSWSAASVWTPMVEDALRSAGPVAGFNRSLEAESPRSRADYFAQAFDETLPFVNRRPPELWYSGSWSPCKEFHIAAARIARREIYSPSFRRWHWRLACEQLIYSHVDRVAHGSDTSPYRYQANTVRQLLVAGEDDDFHFANIFASTQDLAGFMSATPGRSLFLARTGHSIHIERPRYFAGEIVRFLAERPRAQPDLSFLGPLLLTADPEPPPASPPAPDLSFLVPLLLTPP